MKCKHVLIILAKQFFMIVSGSCSWICSHWNVQWQRQQRAGTAAVCYRCSCFKHSASQRSTANWTLCMGDQAIYWVCPTTTWSKSLWGIQWGSASMQSQQPPLDTVQKFAKGAIMIYFPRTLSTLYKNCARTIFSIKGYLTVTTFSFNMKTRHLPSSYYF